MSIKLCHMLSDRPFAAYANMPCVPSMPLQTDILKRLQREAFHDIMRLRERQEKVEKVLSLFKATKTGPFAEESTRVKGIIDVAGSLARDSSEADSGISSRFVFQTTVRKKDSLFAELVADYRYMYQDDDHIGSPLVLSKVMYLSNVSDSFSAAAVPVGARCDDFSIDPSVPEVIFFRPALVPQCILLPANV
jgi:hypothetical protein